MRPIFTPSARHRLQRWSQRVGHEVWLPWNRLLGRGHRLTVSPMGQPVSVHIGTRRELVRATSCSLEAELLHRMLDYLEPGDVFFDVGANIGMISLTVALHPAGRQCLLDSFEPEPRNFTQLVRNIELNGLGGRVSAHQIALGKVEGEAELFVRGTAGDGRHSLVEAKGSSRSIKVAQVTGAAFVRSTGRSPKVVKIDVEGAEGQVLDGLAGVIASNTRPREIFMEVHAKGDGDRMPDGSLIDHWLAERGYALVWSHQRRSGQHRHYR